MGRITRITYLLFRSTMRKLVWPGLLVTGIVFVTGVYLKIYPHEPALAVHMTAYGQLLLTITFMMLGIHIRCEPRSVYFEDVIIAYSRDGNFLLKCQLLLLIIFNFMVTLAILCAVFFLTLVGEAAVWTKQVVLHVILLYSLPCYALSVWGMLISQWATRRTMFFPAILVWLATSSLAIDLNTYFDALGVEGGRVLQSMISMGVYSMRHIQGIVMTPPIERPWWIMRTVISILLTVLLLRSNASKCATATVDRRRKTQLYYLIVLSAVAIMISLGVHNFVFFARFADPAKRIDYVQMKADLYVPGKAVSMAEYPSEKNIIINKNNIILSCTDQGLQAQVEITAQMSKNACGQSFTLYSDFVIDEVLVDGEIAKYERSNDGVMVNYASEKLLGEQVVFRFIYHGYSLPVFPANETTVQLNRAFPWFPWPGIKAATIYSNFYSFDESEAFFIEDWQRGDDVEYTMRYRGPGDLYTNLDIQQADIYKGYSRNGVSLYSGMVHDTIRGVDVYTPGSQNQNASMAVSALLDSYDAIRDLSERLGVVNVPVAPKSIIVIEMSPPIILSYPAPYPSELFAWNSDWEIRQTSTSGTIINRAQFGDNVVGYQNSPYVRAYIPIAYLLTPSCGYPINVLHSSTINFSSWLCYYLLSQNSSASQMHSLMEEIESDFGIVGTGESHDFVNGVIVSGVPIREEERDWIRAIMQRMNSGENFDASFRRLYRQLLNEESVTPSEIITTLYNRIGD